MLFVEIEATDPPFPADYESLAFELANGDPIKMDRRLPNYQRPSLTFHRSR